MRIVGKRVSLSVALALAPGAFAATLALAAPASAAEILSVKNESANFRDGPGDKHAIVYSADRFYPVEVVEKQDGWTKVKDFEGDVAWVADRLLAKQETVVVEGDKVNVREKPNTVSEIAFKSERGEVFKVESHQGKWLKIVDANGDGGWIRDDMVWGEKSAAAESPKGKTKGEIEDPAAKAAPLPAGKAKGDKADKPKAAEKTETKPKEGKPGAKPAAAGGEKAKAGGEKPDDEPTDKAEKADDKADKADKADDKPAEKAEKADDKAAEKADKPAEKTSDDDTAGKGDGDADADVKADTKADDDAG